MPRPGGGNYTLQDTQTSRGDTAYTLTVAGSGFTLTDRNGNSQSGSMHGRGDNWLLGNTGIQIENTDNGWIWHDTGGSQGGEMVSGGGQVGDDGIPKI